MLILVHLLRILRVIFEHLFILKIHNESTIIQNPKGKRKKWSFIVRKKNSWYLWIY